jgi:adenylosuccinate synthase
MGDVKVRAKSDVLAFHDAVACFQGGPNAGHTLFFDGVSTSCTRFPAAFSTRTSST